MVSRAGPEAASAPNETSAWLVIEPDNSVLIRLATPERKLGQGTTTALVMLVAEELGCDWSKVRCEYASANRNLREKGVYKSQTTVGSRGLRSSVQFMPSRPAPAPARASSRRLRNAGTSRPSPAAAPTAR